MEWMITAIGFIVGATGRRIIGSDKLASWGDTIKRMVFWGAPASLIVFAATNSWIAALAALPLAILGEAPGYYCQFGIAGSQNRNFKNLALLSMRGAWIAYPITLASYLATHFGRLDHAFGAWGILAGAFMPAFYFAGIPLQKLTVRIPILNYYTAWGEALTGGAVMAFLTVAF